MTVTKISDLFGASNREGIGLSQFFPMYTGAGIDGLGFPAIELNDRVYLKSGVYTLPSNADSDVQQMQHLQLFDTVQSASAVNERGSVVIASNGSGTCVAGSAQTPITTNLSVSTNNGVTWTNITVGAIGNQYSKVIWTGSRFVIAVGTGNGATAPMIYSSPTGLAGSWVAGAGASLPTTSNPCTDLVTDGAGKVLYLHSSGGWYSADHGVTWASFTNSYTRGFVLNNLWCLFIGASTSYATAPLSSPGAQTSRTLPVAASSTIHLASNGTNLGVLSADSDARSLLISTNGINWETKPVPMSSGVTGIVYSNSKFYMVCVRAVDTSESPGAGFLPYQLYTTSDFINYRVVNLIPRAIGSVTANTTQRLVGVGQNNRVFFAVDTSSPLTTSLRYWDYKTTPDYIGTARDVRVNSNSFYWRIK